MEKSATSSPVVLGDGIATLTLGDTLLVVWLKGATFDRWGWWMAQLKTLAAQRPSGALCLDLITSESSPPDAALRKKAQTDLRELGPQLRKLVVVPLGNSLWQSIVRTIVRGTLLLSGDSNRQVVASSLREGIERIRLEAGPDTPNRIDLKNAIDTICKAMGISNLEPT